MHFINWLFDLETPNTDVVSLSPPIDFDIIEKPRDITYSYADDMDEEDDDDWEDDDDD